MNYLIPVLLYFIGFFLTLTFFKFFGERIGMNYDQPHPEWSDWDDWDNNAQAYIAFSLAWFIVIPVLVIVGLFKLFVLFSKWYLEL